MRFLPSEIYEEIINQLKESDVRPTLLSLTRAIPHSPVPRHQLFQKIHITKPSQLGPLYERIRPREQDTEQPCNWIQVFSLETWTADAEIVLDLLTLLPNLHTLTIWIGPKNFVPEHLEELFSVDQKGRCLKCVGNLRYLSLRFRPYVQKATYQQFLSGSYFDPTLDALSRWPVGRLPTLSIVQDPLTMDSGTSEGSEVSPPATFSLGLPQRTLAAGFAQPLVFFQLEAALPGLLRAPYLRTTLKHLRLRFPSRNLTRSLTLAPLPHPPSYGASIPVGSKPSKKYLRRVVNAHLSPAPCLTFLDLSTCLIPEASLPQILAYYPSLTHIILDDCSILRNGDIAFRDNSHEWGSLSLSCAVAGLNKAKEKEKKLNAWIDALQVREGKKEPKKETKRTRGRKGLATATLSLRKEDPVAPGPSGPSRRGPTNTNSNDPERIRVLPPLPTLRYLSTTLYIPHSLVPEDPPGPDLLSVTYGPLLENINREWERGWAEGLTKLVKARERLRTSWRNKLVRIMRFATPEEELASASTSSQTSRPRSRAESASRSHSPANSESSSSLSEIAVGDDPEVQASDDPLAGLVEVVDGSEFDVDLGEADGATGTSGSGIGKTPVLCFAGISSATSSAELPTTESNTGRVAVRGLPHAPDCAHELGRRVWVDGIL